MHKDDQEYGNASYESDDCICRKSTRREFFKKTAAMGVGVLAGAALPHLAAGAETPLSNPPVTIPDVSIRMKSRDSYLVGVTAGDVMEIKLADVLKFHGYCAGGVAFAFRAAQEAFRVLYGKELPVRQSMKVQTSHHCCQAGALAYITGARSDFGAERSVGDLVLIPPEEKKIVFIDKKGKGQVTLRPLFNPHDTFKPLFRRVIKEEDFAPKVRQALQKSVQEYVNGPVENLFQIERA
ncbi:MAG: FmdE family protein [Desulfobacterales bacterium]|nr:FmdE family protein [Desulfobacterales bacterium]